VDGASKDKTIEIIKKYQDKIDRIVSEPDSGIYYAFNKGISLATGDILYFLNSDDYLYNSTVIQKVASIFQNDRKVKIVYGNVEFRNEATGFFIFKGNKRITMDDFKRGEWPQHSGFFAKKEIFKEICFDVEYKIASDLDLIINFFKLHEENSLYIDETISVFRTGGKSNNIKTIIQTWEETNLILKKHFGVEKYHLENIDTINKPYLKRWMELMLLQKRNSADVLCDMNIKNVAIFGTLELALFLFEDLTCAGIKIITFLDNDTNRQGRLVKGLEIRSPLWLQDNYQLIDAIILTFERNYDEAVKQQIYSILGEEKIPVFSWRELICFNDN
jgi:glycosyltransferase involved in cell wall biosynthesis